jgi:hypothetical protein
LVQVQRAPRDRGKLDVGCGWRPSAKWELEKGMNVLRASWRSDEPARIVPSHSARLPAGLPLSLAIYLGAAICAGAIGFIVGHGNFLAVAIAGALAGSIVWVLMMQGLGLRAITGWVVVGVVAFPFVRYPSGHAQLTFDRLWIFGIGAAGLLAAGRATRRTPASRRVALWLILVTCAIVLRGLLTAGHSLYATGVAVDAVVLPAALFFLARQMLDSEQRWDRLTRAFVIAGAVLGVIGLAERGFGFQLATLSGGSIQVDPNLGARVSGPYGSDDALAVALLMCFAATFLWIQTKPASRLLPGLTSMTLQLTGIYLTLFRGAFIAALAIFVVALGLRPRRYARLAMLLALVAAIASVAYLRAQDTQGLAQRLNNTQNVAGRVATFQQGIEIFKLHPWDGAGLGQFAAAQRNLAGVSFGGVSAVQFAHNSYLDLLSEGGLLVFIPFLGLTVAVVLMIHRYRTLGRGSPYDVVVGSTVAAAALAYLLMSLEETVITSSTVSNAFFALLLGGCASRLDILAARKRDTLPEPLQDELPKARAALQ